MNKGIQKWQLIIFSRLHVNGMTIYPFVLVQNRSLLADKRFLNHEHIHLRQQLEMLVIPFYLAYLFNYLFNRLRFKTHDAAYRNIVFEREAYANEHDQLYMSQRKFLSWMKYTEL